jgi:hypothetical protein
MPEKSQKKARKKLLTRTDKCNTVGEIKENNMPNKEPLIPSVKIEIHNGVATVIHKDIGIHLTIVDKDFKQVGEGKSISTFHSFDQIGKKQKNRRYTRFVDIF